MATTIRQTLRLDNASLQLFDRDLFYIVGPNENVVLPQAWEHMIRPGWHVRLELLSSHQVERACVEMPQTCRQVCGTPCRDAQNGAARMVEETTRELHAIREARDLDTAEREAAREARQRERNSQEASHRQFVDMQNIRDEEHKEREKAQRAREEERSEQREMQQARAAEREEQRIMQQAREHEREVQNRQQEARAHPIDAPDAAGVTNDQKIATQARDCCSATLQRCPAAPGCTCCKVRVRCSPLQKRHARYLIWFAGGSRRYGRGCCQRCTC